LLTGFDVRVVLAADAPEDISRLPLTIRARFDAVITRLERWPAVSGAKPLQKEWKGHYRIRLGDWRVIFRVVRPDLIVVRVAHRSTVYED
jgi:mRNA-degrading endonuclease RelE of RelBE toxin-antitoxin system